MPAMGWQGRPPFPNLQVGFAMPGPPHPTIRSFQANRGEPSSTPIGVISVGPGKQ